MIAPPLLPALLSGAALVLAILLAWVLWQRWRARREAHRAIAREKAFFAELFEAAPEAIVVLDKDDVVLSANQEFSRLFGYAAEEAVGRSVNDLIAPPELMAEALGLAAQVAGGQAFSVETMRRRKDGTSVHVSILGKPFLSEGERRTYGIYRDITERKSLEGQLRQAQKMEAVGRLAGGIAHDFNNLLTVVIGQAQLLLDEELSDDMRWSLEEIDQAASRAARLTQQLLAFSRKQILRPDVLDLNDVVRELEPLLSHLVGERVEVELALGAGVHPVRVDRSQLEQVLVHLCDNARDAMPDGGRVTLSTWNVEPAADPAEGDEAGAAFVALAVSDTGVGIPAGLREHIFEPFFTTKGPGKGTGLGLPTVYGIAKQSGGRVELESKPGKGSKLTVYLPCASIEADAEPQVATLPAGRRTPATVLVVEDEEAVRTVTRRALERHGYTVLTAADGREALESYAAGPARVDLLLTDVVMPRMGGRELAERLLTLDPSLKVMFMTGHTEDEVIGRGQLAPGTVLLRKPVPPSALVAKVAEALGEGTADKELAASG